MKTLVTIILCAILVILGILYYTHLYSHAQPSISLGFTERIFEDLNRSFDGKPRTLQVALWYPTHKHTPQETIKTGIWNVEKVVRDAPFSSNKPLPLIIFSHGYGGDQWSNSWFAQAVAKNGYIVAIVRHYGNSSSTMIPELSVRAWNRPRDMSFVLDKLLDDPQLAPHINAARIGAAGFSQGGITALWLAGIQAHLTPATVKRQITALSDPDWRNEHFADISADRLDTILDKFTPEDFAAANRSYRDERIRAVFAMAPALDTENVMFTADGVSPVSIPVYITVGESDHECLPQAQFFTQQIPNSILKILPGKVTHLTLLNEGVKSRYTIDDPSINRKKLHAQIAREATRFFDIYL